MSSNIERVAIPKNHTVYELKSLLEKFLSGGYFSIPENILDDFVSFFWYSMRKINEMKSDTPKWWETKGLVDPLWTFSMDAIFCYYLQFLFVFNLPEFKKVYYKNYEKSEMVKKLFQEDWDEMWLLNEGKYFRCQKCWTSNDEVKAFFIQEKITPPQWTLLPRYANHFYSMLPKLPKITKERKEFCLEIFCHPMSYEAKCLQENFFDNNQKLLGLKSEGV